MTSSWIDFFVLVRTMSRFARLQLDKSGIHVAEYLTGLPPREVLLKELKIAVAITRERLSSRTVGK